MASLGIVRLVALVLLLLFSSSSLRQQVGVGESPCYFVHPPYHYIGQPQLQWCHWLCLCVLLQTRSIWMFIHSESFFFFFFGWGDWEGAIRLHDRKQHAKLWDAEERKQLRSFMTMDYTPCHRRTSRHNWFSLLCLPLVASQSLVLSTRCPYSFSGYIQPQRHSVRTIETWFGDFHRNLAESAGSNF
jgi:hypothetical protein